MTTIAIKDGIIAVDTRSTVGSIVYGGEMEKLYPLPDGSIASFCGTVVEGRRAVAWLAAKGREKQRLLDEIEWPNITVVQLMPNGVILERCGDPLPVPIDGPYWAWGSGREFAIGAMAAGCSAVEAVLAACKHDKGTGAPVRSMKITPKKKARRK